MAQAIMAEPNHRNIKRISCVCGVREIIYNVNSITYIVMDVMDGGLLFEHYDSETPLGENDAMGRGTEEWLESMKGFFIHLSDGNLECD